MGKQLSKEYFKPENPKKLSILWTQQKKQQNLTTLTEKP